MNMNQKGFANIILIIVVVVLAGVAGYFALTREQESVTQQTTPSPSTTQAPISQTVTSTPADASANWKIYHSEKYKFSFRYPQDYKINISNPFSQYGGTYPLERIELVAQSGGYGDKFSITISSKTAAETVFNIRPFYQPSISGDDLFYDAKKNIWVTWPNRKLVCKETSPLGNGDVPTYHFSTGDAGHISNSYVLIFKDVLLDINVGSVPIGTPDPNLGKVLSSFALDNLQDVITAKCE